MKSYRFEYVKPQVRGPYLIKLRNVRTQRNSLWINGVLALRPNPLDVTTQMWLLDQVNVVNKKTGTILVRDTANRNLPSDSVFEFSASEISRLSDEVENKLHQKIAGIRVNALELYATRIETANMVCKRVGQLANAFLSLKRGRWKQFKRHLGLSKNLKKPGAHKFEDVPALWLEYSFGWSPLLSDVYNILNKTFEPPSTKVEASSSVRLDLPYSKVDGFTKQSGEVQKTCRAKACVMVKVDVPALAALSQYGINNPAAVAWELVPYSFVVDWFLPIGDYIGQMGATAGLAMSDFNITFTTKSFCSFTNDMSGYYTSQGWASEYTWNKSPTVFVKHTLKRRVLIDRQPVYRFLLPEDPMSQSIRRVSYALSLLSLAFGRKPK